MGLISWRLRKYTFQKGNKPYNKGKKYRNKTLPAEKGKFVRLPKDLYDLVTKSVHKKNVQLIPASTKSARFQKQKLKNVLKMKQKQGKNTFFVIKLSKLIKLAYKSHL